MTNHISAAASLNLRSAPAFLTEPRSALRLLRLSELQCSLAPALRVNMAEATASTAISNNRMSSRDREESSKVNSREHKLSVAGAK